MNASMEIVNTVRALPEMQLHLSCASITVFDGKISKKYSQKIHLSR